MSKSDLLHAVPAYFHPAVAPARWTRMLSQGPRIRFVIVNPHNGVGESVEPRYASVVERLHTAKVRLVGYVDTDYGNRSVDDLVAEAVAYRERYAITGLFLDQCATTLELLNVYETYATALRTAGMRFLVFNPGTHPHHGYIDLANVTVTFEGTWQEYQGFEEPDWLTTRPRSRYCHFVYDVPTKTARKPDAIVDGKHVGSVCFTDGTMPNPWDRVPPALRGR